MLKHLLAISLFTMAGTAFACCNSELKAPSSAVKVIDPTFSVRMAESRPVVTVLGTFQNTTENTVGSLVVEAKLTDSAGKLVDVLTEALYGINVPAGQQVAFRMQGAAAANESAYAGVQARVTSGETQQAKPRGEQKTDNRFVSFLITWWPVLLVVLVWLYLIRKQTGKNSPQNRALNLIAEQNIILTKQLAAIETIAAAAQHTAKSEG